MNYSKKQSLPLQASCTLGTVFSVAFAYLFTIFITIWTIWIQYSRHVLPFLCITVTGIAHCLDHKNETSQPSLWYQTFPCTCLSIFLRKRFPLEVHGNVVNLCARNPVISSSVTEAIDNLI